MQSSYRNRTVRLYNRLFISIQKQTTTADINNFSVGTLPSPLNKATQILDPRILSDRRVFMKSKLPIKPIKPLRIAFKSKQIINAH